MIDHHFALIETYSGTTVGFSRNHGSLILNNNIKSWFFFWLFNQWKFSSFCLNNSSHLKIPNIPSDKTKKNHKCFCLVLHFKHFWCLTMTHQINYAKVSFTLLCCLLVSKGDKAICRFWFIHKTVMENTISMLFIYFLNGVWFEKTA